MDGDPLPRDVAIFGGGGAGLWLLDVLVSRGLRVVLLEAGRLGGGQTGCAQGIIHGGFKYTLDGLVPDAAMSVRDMPELWRACLAGRRNPILTGTRVRSDHCYLWRTGSLRSRLGMLGARMGLHTTSRRVPSNQRPGVLASCPGLVARIAEPVIDPVSFVAELAGRHRSSILLIDERRGLELVLDAPGRVAAIRLTPRDGGPARTITPGAVVFTAGAGNEHLAAMAGVSGIAPQQRRPLHMLMLRGALPELNGHCVDGARTRLTITTDSDSAGRSVWQVGGRIAEDGVEMDTDTFLRHGAGEIRATLPGLDLGGVEFSSYRIDRAEAAASGNRPDDVSVAAEGNVIVAWPTKLALLPRLAERIVAILACPDTPAETGPGAVFEDWPRPEIAEAPWECQTSWTSDV